LKRQDLFCDSLGDHLKARSCKGEQRQVLRNSVFRTVFTFLIFGSLWSVSAQNTIPGKFYEYNILAVPGQTPANASTTLSGMGDSPSINSNGLVAFVGQFTGGGEGVVVASPALPPKLISFAPSGTRIFGRAVKVNDLGQVVASDRVSGSPPLYFGRLWDSSGFGAFTTLLRGNSTSPYAAVLGQASVNIHNDAVFGALDSTATQTLLVSVKSDGTVVGQLNLPANSLPRPMIADDGSIVVRFGNQVNSPINLYPNNLGLPQVIASSVNFDVTGNQSGISSDGRIVAFYGVLNTTGAAALHTTPGPGIFAAIDEGGLSRNIVRILGRQLEDLSVNGGNKDGVCDGPWSQPPVAIPETCVPAAELGYDASANPLYFAAPGGLNGFSPSADSRIGIVNVDFGAPGIDNNTFVISFLGKPSGASRDNPCATAGLCSTVLPAGTPLLFSAQQGLWTVRVDVEHVPINSSIPPLAYHTYGVIPVAQVGDRLGTHTLATISVFDPIAAAAQTDAGVVRTQRRGDHRVAFWALGSSNEQLIVRGSHLDSDQDGLLDHWETSGIDMDQDGTVDLNLSAMGAHPFQRDLFVELDWLSDQSDFTFEPAPGVLQKASNIPGPLVSMFANAPALTGNLYGVTSDGSPAAAIQAGIALHVDAGPGKDSNGVTLSYNMNAGPLQGGDPIGMPGAPNALVDVIYFGNSLGFGVPLGANARSFQNIKDTFFGTADKRARELAFHYVVIGLSQQFVLDASNAPFSSALTAASPNSLTLSITPPGSDCTLTGQMRRYSTSNDRSGLRWCCGNSRSFWECPDRGTGTGSTSGQHCRCPRRALRARRTRGTGAKAPIGSRL
jgi:hypothetical protein